MLEYQIVDHASMFPMNCSICQSQKGPFVDTFAENPVGRIYICKSCARRAARIFGFAPGKKLDELQDASVLLEQKDAEVSGLLEEITEIRMQNGSERATVKDLAGRLEEANARLQTIEHLAAQVERGAHELVEAVAPRVLEGVV